MPSQRVPCALRPRCSSLLPAGPGGPRCALPPLLCSRLGHDKERGRARAPRDTPAPARPAGPARWHSDRPPCCRWRPTTVLPRLGRQIASRSITPPPPPPPAAGGAGRGRARLRSRPTRGGRRAFRRPGADRRPARAGGRRRGPRWRAGASRAATARRARRGRRRPRPPARKAAATQTARRRRIRVQYREGARS